MRIVHTVPYFPPAARYGGVPEAVYCLAKAQAELGHQVTVLTSDAGLTADETHPELTLKWLKENYIRARGTVGNLEVIYLKNRWPRLAERYKIFTFYPHRANALTDAKDTVLHLHEVHIPGYRALARSAIRHGIPVCLSAHGSLSPPVHQGMKRWIHRVADPVLRYGWFGAVAAFFALSRDEEKQLRKAGVKSKRIHLQPHGLPSFPEPSELLPFDLKKSLDITTFLYLGRLNEAKGVVTLADAFCRLVKRGHQTRLICCGPDEGAKRDILRYCQTDRIPVLTGEARDEPGVYLFPAVSRACVPELYKIADWSVCPSPYDSFGLSPIESLMCGVPVVTTTAYGCLEHLSHASSGVKRIPPADPERLRAAMEECLSTFVAPSETVLLPLWQTVAESVCEVYGQILRQTYKKTTSQPCSTHKS